MSGVYKVYFTKNNTPWGVIKHPEKGNIYRHTVLFKDNTKKDDFINRFICGGTIDWKAEVEKAPPCAIIPIDEKTLRFTVNPNFYSPLLTFEQVKNSDFAIIKDFNGVYKFYTLKMLNEKPNRFTFQADLDLPFTYDLLEYLDDSKKSFIYQGHTDRFTKKTVGQNQVINLPNWKNIMKNRFEFSPLKEANINPISWQTKADKAGDNDGLQLSQLRWAVVYLSQENLTENKDILVKYFSENQVDNMFTMSHFQKLPYVIVLIPFWVNRDTFEIEGETTLKALEWFNDMIDEKGDVIIAAQFLHHFQINIDQSFNLVSKVNNVKNLVLTNKQLFGVLTAKIYPKITSWYETKAGKKWLADNPRPAASSSRFELFAIKAWQKRRNAVLNAYLTEQKKKITAVSSNTLYYVKDLSKITVNDVNPGYKTLSVWKKYQQEIVKAQNDINYQIKDPVILHPHNYIINLKTWDTMGKQYPFWNLVLEDDATIKVHGLYSFSPNEKNVLFWIYRTNKEDLMGGHYFNYENSDTLSYQQTQLNAYLRDNKSSLKTAKHYDRTAMITNTTLGALGIIGGIAAFSPLAIIAGAVGIASSVLSQHRKDGMRQAKIEDLTRAVPNITTGNSVFYDSFFHKLRDDYAGLQIIEKTIYDFQAQQIEDDMINNGYIINENRNLNVFMTTRRRFNYVQAVNIFQAFKNEKKLSPMIKAEFDKMFREGVTFWHYESAYQWKGVLNYETDNREVS